MLHGIARIYGTIFQLRKNHQFSLHPSNQPSSGSCALTSTASNDIFGFATGEVGTTFSPTEVDSMFLLSDGFDVVNDGKMLTLP